MCAVYCVCPFKDIYSKPLAVRHYKDSTRSLCCPLFFLQQNVVYLKKYKAFIYLTLYNDVFLQKDRIPFELSRFDSQRLMTKQ